MNTCHDIALFQRPSKPIITIGTFDGVHLGHQKIIHRLKEIAAEKGGETAILTFAPHPRMILHPEDENLKLITTIPERTTLFDGFGIDHLIVTPFTRDFSNLTPKAYIKDILVDKIGVNTIVVGYDHRFGKDRRGGMKELFAYAPIFGYEVVEIPEQDVDDVAVSSSRIRQALLSRQLAEANRLLGHPFKLRGQVVKGAQLGRSLGYPTANLHIQDPHKLIPPDGIYAVTVEIDTRRMPGMAYIGPKPTLHGTHRTIEVNIFDFDESIYDWEIEVDFIAFLRADQKFETLTALVHQMDLDAIHAKQRLNIQ